MTTIGWRSCDSFLSRAAGTGGHHPGWTSPSDAREPAQALWGGGPAALLSWRHGFEPGPRTDGSAGATGALYRGAGGGDQSGSLVRGRAGGGSRGLVPLLLHRVDGAHHWALTEQVFRTTVLKTVERVRASPVHLLDHRVHSQPRLAGRSRGGLKTEWSPTPVSASPILHAPLLDILDAPRWGGSATVPRCCSAFLTTTTGVSSLTTEIISETVRCSSASGYLAESLGIGMKDLVRRAGSGCRRASLHSIRTAHPGGAGSCGGGSGSTVTVTRER